MNFILNLITECNVTSHARCTHLVPDFCGMSMRRANEMIEQIQRANLVRKSNNAIEPNTSKMPDQQYSQPQVTHSSTISAQVSFPTPQTEYHNIEEDRNRYGQSPIITPPYQSQVQHSIPTHQLVLLFSISFFFCTFEVSPYINPYFYSWHQFKYSPHLIILIPLLSITVKSVWTILISLPF